MESTINIVAIRRDGRATTAQSIGWEKAFERAKSWFNNSLYDSLQAPIVRVFFSDGKELKEYEVSETKELKICL